MTPSSIPGPRSRRQKSPMLSVLVFTIAFASIAVLYTGVIFRFWAFGFFLVLAGSAFLAYLGYAVGASRTVKVVRPCTTTARLNIMVGVLAILGLLALYYDRTAIRGIDYADVGIAAARAELSRSGERGGLISIFGNLFSMAVYFPLINMVFDWEKWGRERYMVLSLVLAGLAGLTLITAGRTVVFIAVALAVAAMLGRGVMGMRRMPAFLTLGRVVGIGAGIAVLLGLIFALRADAFGAANAGQYLGQICIHLSQPATEIMAQCSSIVHVGQNPFVNDVFNYATAVVLYAFHVAWVGDVIISAPNYGVSTTFVGIQDMLLSRFGYQITATDYDGYFIPAAPGLIFDFGYSWMALSYLCIGLLLALCQRGLLAGQLFLGRICFSYVAAGLLLGVLISPFNLPFYVLSIAVIIIVLAARTVLLALLPKKRPALLERPGVG